MLVTTNRNKLYAAAGGPQGAHTVCICRSGGFKAAVDKYSGDCSASVSVQLEESPVSESIVISPAYAEKLGIEYSVNAIYTGTLKDEIEAGPMIKSVRSRQMIMDSFDTFMEIMSLMVALLIIAGVILGTVVLYNLGVMSYKIDTAEALKGRNRREKVIKSHKKQGNA